MLRLSSTFWEKVQQLMDIAVPSASLQSVGVVCPCFWRTQLVPPTLVLLCLAPRSPQSEDAPLCAALSQSMHGNPHKAAAPASFAELSLQNEVQRAQRSNK